MRYRTFKRIGSIKVIINKRTDGKPCARADQRTSEQEFHESDQDQIMARGTNDPNAGKTNELADDFSTPISVALSGSPESLLDLVLRACP